jgi:hypothetical protein
MTVAKPIDLLERVAPPPLADDPPLGVGDYCRLNSGSEAFLIIDVDDDFVWVGPYLCFLRECVRRAAN